MEEVDETVEAELAPAAPPPPTLADADRLPLDAAPPPPPSALDPPLPAAPGCSRLVS
ncbi:MAG TPA: hypothetical protein VGM56_01070 [Byssovorax sp.]